MVENTLHRDLLRPEAYPEETGPIGYRETHISRLYFTDRHVYKIKKAVDFGFLNFTTLDRRRFYCHEEVRLNRRFCPDTYLDVVEIRKTAQRHRVGGEGEIVDYAVRMKRLPEEHMLVHLLQAADPSLPAAMQRVGRRLALLHRDSEIVRSDGGRSDLDTLRHNWQENFTQTAPFVGQTLFACGQEACTAYVERFFTEHASLLHERQEQGFVRDGHGDLHAEHICLTDPVCIYDCIEFNRRFRVADVAADLAFLLMDLDFRERRDLAAITLEAYRKAGKADRELPRLLPFYKVYRAWVRGKVESLLAADAAAEAETRSAAAKRSRRYFSLALGYLCPPVLVMTCGLMGVGKTTVARSLAAALGARLLRTDELRKTLAGLPATAGRPEPFEAGIYSAGMTAKTYDLLLKRCLAALAAGESVIADAAFLRRAERERFAAAAKRKGFPWLLALMECPAETALDRLDRRQVLGQDASDGRRELYASQAAAFEPPAETENIIRIDTAGDVDYNVQRILCAIIERDRCPDERA
ncbi:MAG TPA: AAA family ATPase [Desulfuromonadales bacterium]|nr:AAA family ATPase [Desulfuromonadales bacterium]